MGTNWNASIVCIIIMILDRAIASIRAIKNTADQIEVSGSVKIRKIVRLHEPGCFGMKLCVSVREGSQEEKDEPSWSFSMDNKLDRSFWDDCAV
jgi:hypothetical protein